MQTRPRTVGEAVREAAIFRSGALFVGANPCLTAIVAQASKRFGTRMAAITIVHGEWQHVIAAVGSAPGTFRRSASFCAYATETPDEVLCIPDARADERYRHTANVVGGDRIRFYAGASIVGAGQPLGALCVFDSAVRAHLDHSDRAALQALAAEAMATIDRLASRSALQDQP